MIFSTNNIQTDIIKDILLEEREVALSVVRLDKLHPVISGNKLFKLHYFLKDTLPQSTAEIVTFGGAFSNHLVATAFACKQLQLSCTGIVRGERASQLAHTLMQCLAYDMKLKFISRAEYDKKDQDNFIETIKSVYKNCIIIPEGGFHFLGAKGAAEIMNFVPQETTHICCAVGTATTLSGLLTGLKNEQQLIAFPVIKNMHDIAERIEFLTGNSYHTNQLKIMSDYHFGGYAKKTQPLIDFMNLLFDKHQLPTDFVYTAKMMFGIFNMIKNNVFEKGSKIVCIHTGGLQGNLSLGNGVLNF